MLLATKKILRAFAPAPSPVRELNAEPFVPAPSPVRGTIPERHEFEVSRSIIRHLIERQAGSVEKAILETVMNALDARAQRIEIDFTDDDRIIISDNGRGFQSRQSITKHFGVFGFSHETDEERSYQRTVGKFGLGRGQLMSFAATRWETNQFEMKVDIRESDLVFELLEHPEPLVKGCRITADLYEPLTRLERAASIDEIKRQVRYAPIDVIIDGRRVNRDLESTDWTERTGKLCFKLGSSARKGVEVYNAGIYVCTYPHHLLGTSGVLVSHSGHTFELNTARNDLLMARCALWNEAKTMLDRHAAADRKKGRLVDADRMAILRQIEWGEASAEDHLDTPLFKTVNGRHMSPRQLMQHSAGVVTVAPTANSLKAEFVHRAKEAAVLAPEMVEWMNARDGSELTGRLVKHFSLKDGARTLDFKPVDYKTLERLEADRAAKIRRKDWTLTEQAAMHALDQMSRSLSQRMEPHRRKRTVTLGSYRFLACTDGKRWIMFGQEYLHREIDRGPDGWDNLLSTMVHEYSHDEPDERDHTHGPEFYDHFHDTIASGQYRGWRLVFQAFRAYASERERLGLTLTRQMSQELDRADLLDKDASQP